MRINDPEDRAIRLHSHAIAAAREPNPATKTVQKPCTAVWAESFSKIMGEGVAGDPEPAMRCGVDLAKPGTDTAAGVNSRKPSVIDAIHGSVRLPPGGALAVNAVGDGFVGVKPPNNTADHAAFAMKANIAAHKVAALHREGSCGFGALLTQARVSCGLPAQPFDDEDRKESLRQLGEKFDKAMFLALTGGRKPGEFFVGDRVYVTTPGMRGLCFTLLRSDMHRNWTARADGKNDGVIFVQDHHIRLLDEQPDVS